MSWLEVIAVPIGVAMAIGSGRRVIFWAIACALFGFWAIFILAWLPNKPVKPIILPKSVKSFVIARFAKKTFKDVKVVADLI